MTITRVGSTSKYADGWDVAFGGKRAKKKTTATTKTAKGSSKAKATASKAPAKKASVKKKTKAKKASR